MFTLFHLQKISETWLQKSVTQYLSTVAWCQSDLSLKLGFLTSGESLNLEFNCTEKNYLSSPTVQNCKNIIIFQPYYILSGKCQKKVSLLVAYISTLFYICRAGVAIKKVFILQDLASIMKRTHFIWVGQV